MTKVQLMSVIKKTVSIIDKYYETVYIVLFTMLFYASIKGLSGAPLLLADFSRDVAGLFLPFLVVIWLVRNLASRRREAVIGLILVVIMIIISGKSGYAGLQNFGMLAVGSFGVDYRKVVKCTGILAIVTVLYTFLYAFAIDPSINTVYIKVNRIRSTMGFNYPTDAASFVLYTCLAVLILGKICPPVVTFLLSVISLILAYFYFDSITSTIISVALCLTVIATFLYEKKKSHIPEIPKWLCVLAQLGLYALVPALTVVQIVLAHYYGKEAAWAVKANDLLHSRVGLTYNGLIEHGITMWGNVIDMQGAGTPGINVNSVYNYLDSSYINIPVRHGLIVAICFLLSWIVVQRKAVKSGNVFIIAATILISIHSFEEQHFAELAYNPLLYLPFASGFENDGEIIEILPFVKKNFKRVVMSMAGAIFIIVLLPYIFSTTRTIADLFKYDNVSERLEADSRAVNLILDAREYPVYADVLTGKYARKFKGIKRSTLSGNDLVRKLDCTIITDVDVNSYTLFSRGAVYTQISDHSAVYTTDHAVILALQEAGYHVAGFYYQEEELNVGCTYKSDSIPVLYDHMELFGKIDVDDIGESEDGVATVKIYAADNSTEKTYNTEDVSEKGTIDYDIRLNTQEGAVSYEIEGGIGTTISPLPSVLLENGLLEHSVDAQLSGTKSDEALVYEGKYTLRAMLEMADYDSFYDDVAAKLTLIPRYGTESTRDIYLRDFSEDGALEYETVFSSPGDYYTFLIEPVGGSDIKVNSLSIIKTPDYDIHSTYDSAGHVTRAEYYDLQGNKVLTKEGAFAYEYEYDKNDNTTVIRYYDMDNSLVLSTNGYAEVHREFDNLDHLIYESYYDENGVPLTNNRGYASYSQEVDVWGKPLYIRYFDRDGNRVTTAYGYSAIRKEYNTKDQVDHEVYYDENDNRLALAEGYSGCRYYYDDAGHQSKIIYLDDNDEPVIISKGYAEIDRQYDEKGNIVVESYHDTEGNLMLLEQGYAAIVRVYDDYGDNISTMYFGLDTSEGYIEIRREYDDQKRLIYEGKFNSDGEGLILYGEYSAYRQEYDDAGNVISVKYYGTDGNTMLIGGEWFESRRKFDENKRIIYETFWGPDGDKVIRGGGYHGLGYSYDDNNNRNVVKYYDADDNPVLNIYGYFEMRRTFDESGRVIAESYYGLNGEAVLNTSGFSSLEREYDSDGDVSVERHYDLEGNLIEG